MLENSAIPGPASLAFLPEGQARRSGRFDRAVFGLGQQTDIELGHLRNPHQAEAIVADGDADCVALAREFPDDPRWAWHAAAALGAEPVYPPQYLRARLEQWPGAALTRIDRRRSAAKLRADEVRRSPVATCR